MTKSIMPTNGVDPLSGHYRPTEYENVQVQDMAPSAVNMNLNGQRSITGARNDTRNENEPTEWQKEILDEINGLGKSSSAESIESWIKACRDQHLKLDIDRLARFAVCKDALKVVKYLVDHEQASLAHRDTYGRSAIFYTLWSFPDHSMLRYVASKIPAESKLQDINHQDSINRRTPLHYAAERGDIYIIRSLLEIGAHINIADRENETPISIAHDQHQQHPDDERSVIMLLLEFCYFLSLQPSFRVGVLNDCEDVRILLPSELMSTMLPDLRNWDIPWLHLPEANGIAALFILTQYYGWIPSNITTDTFLSMFRKAVRIPTNSCLPYLDPAHKLPFHESDNLFENDPTVTIVFPCLVLRTREEHKRARKNFQKVRAELPVGFSNSALQPERTLDEMYFPSLSANALDTRNENQVVSREYEPTKKSLAGQPILMVPQLWIWMHKRCILTAYPAHHAVIEPLDFTTIRRTWAWKNPDHPRILIGMIIAHHISEFGRGKDGFPSILDIFESSVCQILTEVDAYMDPKTISRPEMKTEHNFMFRIADIREELVMIQHVLGQQFEVLSRVIDDYDRMIEIKLDPSDPDFNPLKDDDRVLTREDLHRLAEVKHCTTKIKNYQKQVEKIDGDAERVEKRIQDQLNLKRTHASINDARLSLILGTAVIGFTVITVIFAPLAFMTALFALPLDVLLKNQFQLSGPGGSSGATVAAQPMAAYSTRYVATWFAVAEVVSLAVTILLVMFCVWLLGGTKSFAALQGNNPDQKKARLLHLTRNKGTDRDAAVDSAHESSSVSGQTQTGFRRRAVNSRDGSMQGGLSEV